MFITPEKFAAANKASVNALLSVANTALSSAGRIAEMNLHTSRAWLEDGAANAKALIGAKDPQEVFMLSVSQAQLAVEQGVAYNRSLYEISAQTKEEVCKLLDSQFSDFQNQVSSLIDTAAKNAPAGSEIAVAAVKSALEAANSSFGNMRNIVKQAAEIGETNLIKASSAAYLGKKKQLDRLLLALERIQMP